MKKIIYINCINQYLKKINVNNIPNDVRNIISNINLCDIDTCGNFDNLKILVKKLS